MTPIDAAQIAAGWMYPNALLQHAVADLEELSIDLVELERKRDLMVRELRSAGYALRDAGRHLLPLGTLARSRRRGVLPTACRPRSPGDAGNRCSRCRAASGSA